MRTVLAARGVLAGIPPHLFPKHIDDTPKSVPSFVLLKLHVSETFFVPLYFSAKEQ